MVYIGRCHEMDDERIVLLDLDEHDGEDGRPTITRLAQRRNRV